MSYFLQQLANAVPVAALYAALAFGYALAFGMTRRADITYGALFAFAGQIYLLFTGVGWNDFRLIFPAALAFGAALSLVYAVGAGALIARSVMRPLYRLSPNTVIVASLAVLIVLSETGRLALESGNLWLPPFLNTSITFWRDGTFSVTLTVIQIGNAGLMTAIVLGGQAVLRQTRVGRIWRAVADDPLAAELCGAASGKVFVLAYVAASAIAATCGLLATSYYGTMDFGAGLVFGLKVVLIAAAGGHAHPLRAAVGAAGVGVAETFWSGYAPILWRDFVIVSALVVLLVLSRRERLAP